LPNPKAKLRDQLHEVMRFKQFSLRTEVAYWNWIRQFLQFHRVQGVWRHPRELVASDIAAFLSDLSLRQKVAAVVLNRNLHLFLNLPRVAVNKRLRLRGG